MTVATALAVVAATVSLLVGTSASADAATHTATVMAQTQRMSSDTLNSTQHSWYARGAKITLSCYARGESVKGYYSPYIRGGWDNLWYRVSDGYWVADVDINTGSDNPVTGACSAPTVAAGRYNAKIVAAAKAVRTGTYGGQCLAWVESMIRKAGGPAVVLTGPNNGSGYQASWPRFATQITSWSQVRPGDIVQFYTPAKGPHTAIIMSGTTEANAQEKFSNMLVGTYPNLREDELVHTQAFSADVKWFGAGTYKIWRIK